MWETNLPTISHNHDFWWEDSGEVSPTCKTVTELYEKHAPPSYPSIKHLVINRLAQAEVKKRKNLDAIVVPNVFDFNRSSWEKDEYNGDFRQSIGIGENDIMLLQATRILDRKGVEMAIDLVAKLKSPTYRTMLENQKLYDGRTFSRNDEIVLVCAGYVEGIGLSGSYHQSLEEKAKELGVKVIWCADQVKHSRGTEFGKKIYSLWDSYALADFVTYPSIWEGWGNQFIEAIFAKLPVYLFEYPVYVTDLKRVGFETVSLGSEIAGKDSKGLVKAPENKLEEAATQVVKLLTQADLRNQIVEKNFKIAKENFSLEALEKIITDLLQKKGFH